MSARGTAFLLGLICVCGQLNAAVAGQEPRGIYVPPALRSTLESFEPSAAIYSERLGRYIVASDDTNKRKNAMLFTMDERGQVDEAPMEIPGLKKMADIESMSEGEDGALYVMSSQGLNKKGKEQKERNLLVRIDSINKKAGKSKSIELRPLLLAAIVSSKDSRLQKIASTLERKLDIESSFIKNGELFVGLKEPQPRPGVAFILRLGSITKVVDGNLDEVTVWKEVDFAAESGDQDLLSDMVWQGDTLFLSSTTRSQNGRVWSWNDSENLKVLQEFRGLKPEGLALDANKQDLLVLFDQGSKGDGMFSYLRP